MLYREAGDFKTTYRDDAQTFPIAFDRYRYFAVIAVAFGLIPFLINDYWANAVFLPVLIFAIAALGAEHSDRLLRTGLSWHRRVHGRGGLCLLQADDRPRYLPAGGRG